MAKYNTKIGVVQFEPTPRKAAGQSVRDVLIQVEGRDEGRNVKLTIWPEFSQVEFNVGDVVAASGKYTRSSANGKEYENLSVSTLNVNGVTYTKGAPSVDNALEDDEDSPF